MYESIKMDMRRLQVDYQFLGRQIQMKNHQNLILVKMQLEKNNENDIERILDDKDGNGSAQKYGKEYSPKSGDKFVLSVAKGETVVLTKEIINTTCRGMPNSCTIQRRHNLRTKQNQLRQAERRHSHNKRIPRRNDQRQSQRKSDKTTGQRTKKRTLR